MKIAILGGSFNPVHIGHLSLADAVLTALGYDRVILVPAFQSPFKIGAEGASPADRMEMLAASIPSDPRLIIDDCEIKREGVSYTIDTLKDIIARYRPERKPGLILGDDLASTFCKWRSPGEIAELADIIIARRLSPDNRQAAGAGEEFDCSGSNGTGGGGEKTEGFQFLCIALENEIISVSSRQVREKISKNEDWRYLVPSGARYIIEDRLLYGFSVSGGSAASAGGPGAVPGRGGHGLSEIIVRIENDARSSLSPSRFIHSRNTAVLAWDLCCRFGLDAQKGYLAGIAHDICKPLENGELMRLAHRDGGKISRLEQAKPGLLHARAAAVTLQKKYGIDDKDILEAIRYHTTGIWDMGLLAKAVYIADKIEISRAGVDPELRNMSLSSDLDTLFAAVLDNTVAYLKSHQVDISYGTRRLLAAMNRRNSL
jgi:nicotinate-nucleotide adenylyltransferase